MAKLKTLKELAKKHPDCLHVHAEIKSLIPEADAEVLLKHGFRDCSWGNDEAPSFYIPSYWCDDEVTIMAVDELDDEYNRISDKISYIVTSQSQGFFDVIDSIDEAIALYKDASIFKKQEVTQ
jgi:hypothetical protein